MARFTFVLGAGFSALQQFPLVRGLKERVIHFLEAERHVRYELFLESGNGGYERGQFYAGLETIDPDGALQFEELLIALRKRCENTFPEDPCYVTQEVMKVGCARLLWCMQNSIWKVETAYSNFASRMKSSIDSGKPNI